MKSTISKIPTFMANAPRVPTQIPDQMGGVLSTRQGRPLHSAIGVHQLANDQSGFRVQLLGQGELFLRE